MIMNVNSSLLASKYNAQPEFSVTWTRLLKQFYIKLLNRGGKSEGN